LSKERDNVPGIQITVDLLDEDSVDDEQPNTQNAATISKSRLLIYVLLASFFHE
jgi:hypothetical protein